MPGLFATAILGASDETLGQKLQDYRRTRADKVAAADERVRAKLANRSV